MHELGSRSNKKVLVYTTNRCIKRPLKCNRREPRSDIYGPTIEIEQDINIIKFNTTTRLYTTLTTTTTQKKLLEEVIEPSTN
jgi:hypothetical protein